MLWFIFENFINIYECFLFIFFASTVLKLKESFNKYYVYIIGTAAELIALILLNKINYFEYGQIIIYSIILFIYTVIFTEGTILKKILVSLIPTNCVLASSLIASNFVSIIYGTSINNLMTQSTNYRIFFVLLGNLIFLILIIAIKSILNKEVESLTKREWAIMITVFSLSIITLILTYSTLLFGVSDNAKMSLSFIILCIFLINISTYFLLIQLSKKHAVSIENTILKQQYQAQNNSIKEIKNQYEKIQKITHDFNNSIFVIQSLCTQQKYDEALKYMNDYLKTKSNTIHFVDSDNEYVNAILNSLFLEAHKKEIKIRSNISNNIKWENNVDLCNLIGNILKNSIEACEKCDRKEIVFELTNTETEIEIIAKNTINKSVLTDNMQLKTSKQDKSKHGFGTKIIKEITRKYDGFCDFYEQDDMFCCYVSLYKK